MTAVDFDNMVEACVANVFKRPLAYKDDDDDG